MIADARFWYFSLVLQIDINAEYSTIKIHQPFFSLKRCISTERVSTLYFTSNEAIKIQSVARIRCLWRNNIPTSDNLSPIESVRHVNKVFGFCGRLTHSKTAFLFPVREAVGLWGPVTESRHTVVCAYQMNGTLHDLGRHSWKLNRGSAYLSNVAGA